MTARTAVTLADAPEETRPAFPPLAGRHFPPGKRPESAARRNVDKRWCLPRSAPDSDSRDAPPAESIVEVRWCATTMPSPPRVVRTPDLGSSRICGYFGNAPGVRTASGQLRRRCSRSAPYFSPPPADLWNRYFRAKVAAKYCRIRSYRILLNPMELRTKTSQNSRLHGPSRCYRL